MQPRFFANGHLSAVLPDDRSLHDCDKGWEAIGFLDPDAGRTILNQAFPNRVFGRAGLPLELPLRRSPVFQILVGLKPSVDEFFVVLVKSVVLVDEILFPVRHVGGRFPLEIGDPDREANDLHVDSVVEVVPSLEDLLLMLGDPIRWIGVFFEDRVDRVVGFLHEFREFDLQRLVSVLGVIDAKNVDTLADLGDAELIRTQNPRLSLKPIAEVVERLADDVEGVPVVVGDQITDVLEHDVFRVLRLEDAGHLEEKGPSSLVVEP